MKIRMLAAAVAASLAVGAHAAAVTTVYKDDFNADPVGEQVTPIGWAVDGGTVDILGNGGQDPLPGNGRYVDLDGSTDGLAGVMSKTFTGLANGTYTLSFYLAGNQYLPGREDVFVDFGGTTGEYTPAKNLDFTNHKLVAEVTDGTLTLSFHDLSNDGHGALLDRVRITTTAVPEPAGSALLLAGLGALGFAARRRRG